MNWRTDQAEAAKAAADEADLEMCDVTAATDAQAHESAAEKEADEVPEKCPDRIAEALATVYKDEPVKLAELVVEYTAKLHSQANGPQSRDDAGRSHTIGFFAGKPEQLGKDASHWLHTVEVYQDSVDCKRPVPKAATYLRGDAQTWRNTKEFFSL